MKANYQNLIDELDGILSLLRDEWLAANLKNKNKWLQKINKTLDERLRLMKLRDSES